MNLTPFCYLLCLLLWLCPLGHGSTAKGGSGPGIDIGQAEFLLLELEVQRLLSFDFEGYLYRDKLYIPATQLFSNLKLVPSYRINTTSLEVRHPASNQTVHVDFIHNQTEGFPEPVIITDHDYILGTNEVYLRKKWVEQAFGFTLVFDYRRLKLMLFSKNELPVIRNYRRKQMYSTFKKNTHIIKPDVIQPANRHLFNGWIANWSLSSSHNLQQQNYAYGLALGGHLLGGELTIRTGGSRQHGLHLNQTKGHWRFPFYSSAIVQQLVVGDQSRPDALGGTHMTFRGLSIGNRPKKPYKEFTSYRFSRYLKEGWDAELYVNHTLSDVFSSRQDSVDFTLPLRYGSNHFTLKYFNPDGKIFNQQFQFQIPKNFLPPGKVEYDLTAGRYRNYEDQLFANGLLKWGVSPNMTLAGGLRYHPEAVKTGRYIPYLQTWFRLGHRFIIEGSHAYNHFSGGALNYTTLDSKRFNLNVKKYHRASIHNKLRKSLEISANTSFPVNLSFLKLSAYLRGTYSSSRSSHFSNLYGGFSTSLPANIQARINTRLSFRSSNGNPLQPVQHTTEVQFSKRLFWKYLLRPSFQFDHTQNRLLWSRMDISRRVFNSGYFSLSMQYNHLVQQSSVYLRFTLNLPFARHSSYISTTQNYPTFNQSTSGTVVLAPNRNIYTDRRNWISKAVARIDPFLDLNNNDQKDRDEPRIDGLKADFYEKGRMQSPVRRNRELARNLVPYESYFVQVVGSSLDNPLWIPKYKSFQITVSPNMINRIPVPIQVSGEIAGTVRMRGGNGSQRMSGLDVFLYDEHGTVQDTLRTYSNGSFFKIGLKPGRYAISLNRKQLNKRAYYAVEDSVRFEVESTVQGDIVEGIDLEVTSRAASIQDPAKGSKTYAIQIGAFQDKDNALHFANRVSKLTGHISHVTYDKESNLYKSRLGKFSSPEAAWKQFDVLQKEYPKIFRWSFIIDLKAE